MKCKTCKFFKRGKWHAVMGGGKQKGGKCKLISAVLGMDNNVPEKMYVYEEFGCSLHQERKVEKCKQK